MQLPEQNPGTAESWLIDREDEALLENAIAALPAQCRQIFALRNLQGLTYRDCRIDWDIDRDRHVTLIARAASSYWAIEARLP